jgi:transposase
MPSVNKQSLREEFDGIKAEFKRLSEAGQISGETRALFQGMILLFELVLAVFMEKTTKKTSVNSSKPSSQTDQDESALPHPGRKGKGKAERVQTSANSRTVESVTLAKVSVCERCGEDLTKTASHAHERRTKIDIVFEKVVEHVDAQIKQCPTCHATTKGRFPADMPGPLQYGNGIKAYVINLLIGQMVALNRVQKSLSAMIGAVISEASLLNFVFRLHQALAGWESQAIEQLLKSPTVHSDETSLRVDKKNHWIHVYSAGDITLKFLHPKRGAEAIESINIIPRYGGVVIHDCWPSYLSYDHCDHGLCGSHLLRELTFIVESNGYAWAKNMKALLQQSCHKVSKSKRKKLTAKAYANLQKRYRNILTRAEKELPPIPVKPKGRRGRIAKSDAHNLWERLQVHEQAVLLFAKNANVSFTNNRAERDLRMSKVKQKVSGCFRNVDYAHAYCRISSYLQTMANKGHNPLIAIQMAFNNEIGS